jgi:hypothetical protein
MKTGNVFRPSLDDRACAVVRLGRELSRLAEAVFPVDGPDADVVARTLRRLADRDPFDPADDVPLRALRAILVAELGEELADSNRRSTGLALSVLGEPVSGDGDVQSARAHDLAQLVDVFDRFLSLREATLDQIAAEQALARLIGPSGTWRAAPRTAENGYSA